MIEHLSHLKFGKKRGAFSTDLDSDYVQIAKGFGCYAERVENPEQIRSSLEKAANSNLPAVVVIPTKKVSPMGAKLMAGFNQLKF